MVESPFGDLLEEGKKILGFGINQNENEDMRSRKYMEINPQV